MGFIEETGAAQYYRDARITAIYEGTNGIQAIDLVGRKIGQAGGETLKRVIAGWRKTVDGIAKLKDPAFGATAERIEEAIKTLERASKYLLAAKPDDVLAGATPYQRLFGLVAGASYLAEAALAARSAKSSGDASPAHDARIATARFFAENLLPAVAGLEATVVGGAASVMQSEAALVA
jgi:butyryl-CoA dehydrogenase